MQTVPDIENVAQRLADSLRVTCASCEHSEFIHSDRDGRSCLYSECACPAFERSADADPDVQVLERPTAPARKGRERSRRRGPLVLVPRASLGIDGHLER